VNREEGYRACCSPRLSTRRFACFCIPLIAVTERQNRAGTYAESQLLSRDPFDQLQAVSLAP